MLVVIAASWIVKLPFVKSNNKRNWKTQKKTQRSQTVRRLG
jgi:hypothetical protein